MRKVIPIVIVIFLGITIQPIIAGTSLAQTIGEKERCPVCGMFVAKYIAWATQLQMTDGGAYYFDGVKDMMACYFEPEKYGVPSTPQKVSVRDYYNQQWIDGKKAYYVSGSDTLGPMGHEFIPFATIDEAEGFKKDHHGKSILTFDQITLESVNEIRSGMKGQKMHTMKKQ